MRTFMPAGWSRSIFMAITLPPWQMFISAEDAATIPAIAIGRLETMCNGLGTLWTGFCKQIEARGSKPPMARIAVISFVPVLRDLVRRQQDCGRECNQIQRFGEKDCDLSR